MLLFTTQQATLLQTKNDNYDQNMLKCDFKNNVKSAKFFFLPEAKAIVHSWGSTVKSRPSYRISAFDIRLILEPNSGIPVLMINFLI